MHRAFCNAEHFHRALDKRGGNGVGEAGKRRDGAARPLAQRYEYRVRIEPEVPVVAVVDLVVAGGRIGRGDRLVRQRLAPGREAGHVLAEVGPAQAQVLVLRDGHRELHHVVAFLVGGPVRGGEAAQHAGARVGGLPVGIGAGLCLRTHVAHDEVHMVHPGRHVARIAARHRALVVVDRRALEADAHRHAFPGGSLDLLAHGGPAGRAGYVEVQGVDQVAEHAEAAARAQAVDQSADVALRLGGLPDVGLGVFAGVVAAAVVVGVDLEVRVGVGDVPDASAFAQQRVPHASQLRHDVVGAAVGTVGLVGVDVGRGVAAAVGFELVAHHAFDGEHDLRCQVVHLAEVGDGVLVGVARGVVDQRVAVVRILFLQPRDGLDRVVAGLVVALRVPGLPAGHVGRVEQGLGAGGEEVLEFLGRAGGGLPGAGGSFEDADADVVVRGHVPLEGRIDQLALVVAGILQRLDARHLVAFHAVGEGPGRGQQVGCVVVLGRAQVVGHGHPVQAVAREGLAQQEVQGLRGARIVGLHRVRVQVAGGPAALLEIVGRAAGAAAGAQEKNQQGGGRQGMAHGPACAERGSGHGTRML